MFGGYISRKLTGRKTPSRKVVIAKTVDCSIEKLFRPIISRLKSSTGGDVLIGEDDFVVLQVDGEGLDAGKRVLDLTSPIAFAGM